MRRVSGQSKWTQASAGTAGWVVLQGFITADDLSYRYDPHTQEMRNMMERIVELCARYLVPVTIYSLEIEIKDAGICRQVQDQRGLMDEPDLIGAIRWPASRLFFLRS